MSMTGKYLVIDRNGKSKKVPFLVEPHADFELPEGSVLSYAHYYADMPACNREKYGEQPNQRVKYREAEAFVFIDPIVGEPRFSVLIQSSNVSDMIALRRHLYAKYINETSIEMVTLEEKGEQSILGATVSEVCKMITVGITEVVNVPLRAMDIARRFMEPTEAIS